MAKKLTIPAAIKLLKDDYNIHINELDMYKANGVVYLATSKICELIKTTPHSFSLVYSKALIASGVRRVQLGRNKYYCLIEVLTRIDKAIEKNRSLIDICELMS